MLLEETPDSEPDQECERGQRYDHDDTACTGILSLDRVGLLCLLIGWQRVRRRKVWLGRSVGHGSGLKLIGAGWELLLEGKVE